MALAVALIVVIGALFMLRAALQSERCDASGSDPKCGQVGPAPD
jgi:hypothetical protein